MKHGLFDLRKLNRLKVTFLRFIVTYISDLWLETISLLQIREKSESTVIYNSIYILQHCSNIGSKNQLKILWLSAIGKQSTKQTFSSVTYDSVMNLIATFCCLAPQSKVNLVKSFLGYQMHILFTLGFNFTTKLTLASLQFPITLFTPVLY